MRGPNESLAASRRSQLMELGGLFQVEEAAASAYREAAQSTFQQTYYDHPDGFVSDCIIWGPNEHPANYQLSILTTLPDSKRLTVRAPHGIGKSAIMSWLILWFALTRDGEDWKCVTTASSWRQLIKYLWPEVHKWSRRLRWDKIGREPFGDKELMLTNLKLRTGEAFAVASNKHDLIEGAHADQMLYIYDEAKAIPNATFDAAEGAFSTGHALALACSTPGEPEGRFYDIHARKKGFEDWAVRHVTKTEAIAAGRFNAEWAEQRRLQWGEQSAVYQNRVEGEFCASDEDGVIPLSWIERANERYELWKEAGFPGVLAALGGDLGEGVGKNKTVLALGYNVEGVEGVKRGIGHLRRSDADDLMQSTGKIVGLVQSSPELRGYIDAIGVGAGVLSRLREQEITQIAGFKAGARTDAKDSSGEFGFYNLRSHAWWNARELLDPANGEDIALPPDDKLTGDLTAPHWKEISNAKIQVEGKDDVWPDKEGNPRQTLRKRLGRSPDDGDAVVMALYRASKAKPHKLRWA